MSRLAALLRGFLAQLVLAALLVGAPMVLWRLVGGRFPTSSRRGHSSRPGLTAHGIPDTVLFKILACICWLAWAGLAASVVAEAAAVIRGRAARKLPLLGFLQPVVANLVATLALAVLVASSRPQQTGPASLQVALGRYNPVVATAKRAVHGNGDGAQGAHPITAPASNSYVVAPRDTLWGIAERELGDPRRWREIFRLNEGRPQPHGRSLEDPDCNGLQRGSG
jgi:hypothetical protein